MRRAAGRRATPRCRRRLRNLIKEWRDAAIRGDVSAVRSQLAAGVSINALDRYGQSALMLAARHGHAEVGGLLIPADLNITAKFGLSALMLAIVNLHAEVPHLLVDAVCRS